MDQLDFEIFKSVGFRSFGRTAGDISRLNPWTIARKVGVDGNTVKLRLNKMIESGFIKYFQIYPNYRLLGIKGAAYFFELDNILEKYEIIEKCSLVDGVVEIHNFIGPNISIDFTYADGREESRRLALFRELTKCDSPEKFYERVMPPLEVENLTIADWRIIKALRYDAFKPLSSVARELGLTTKTVRNRFERMISINAVVIVPQVNPAGIADTITYVLLVYPSTEKSEEVIEKVMKEFYSTCFLAISSWKGNSMFCMSARNLSEIEDSLIRAKKIEGMLDVKLLILRETREFTEWIDNEIDKKIAQAMKQKIPVTKAFAPEVTVLLN